MSTTAGITSRWISSRAAASPARSEAVPSPPTGRRDLETVCLKCLQKEPGQRYASAQDLADDLRRYLERRPVRARPVGPTRRLLRWGRRSPLVASLGGAVLALFVTVSVIATWAAV